MTLTLTWLSDFFHYFFDFFSLFWFKKGPNCPKVCLKCKILTKWPFGTKRKRQNVFSRSPSTSTFLYFSKKSSQDLTWLFLKKLTFGKSAVPDHFRVFVSILRPETIMKRWTVWNLHKSRSSFKIESRNLILINLLLYIYLYFFKSTFEGKWVSCPNNFFF
jgi:hypothetical protein